MAKKQNSDQLIVDTIKLVSEKKAAIAAAERPVFRTNMSFSFVEGQMQNALNLHVQTDVRVFIGIAAFLIRCRASYDEASALLRLDDPPQFSWFGFSIDDWISDIKTRINKIQIVNERKKLEQLEERLNRIVSPELRARLELESITKELNVN